MFKLKVKGVYFKGRCNFMARSETGTPGSNRSRNHDVDKKMKTDKNAVQPKAEIRKRNGGENKISDPR
jgi:hypothetical protein